MTKYGITDMNKTVCCLQREDIMKEKEAFTQQEQNQKDNSKFTEINEFTHENNEVAKAQKQIASQETTGVIDQH
jgi:predicted GNAT family acetyltransferase